MASPQRKPSFLNSYEDDLEEIEDDMPPPVPVRTEGAKQLENVPDIDERFQGTSDTMYAEVPRTPVSPKVDFCPLQFPGQFTSMPSGDSKFVSFVIVHLYGSVFPGFWCTVFKIPNNQEW